jgi:hypothetical protein
MKTKNNHLLGTLSESSPDWFCVAIGDTVTVRVRSDSKAHDAGDYEMQVIQADSRSFAVGSTLGMPWWFYRNDGQCYVGDAHILPLNINEHFDN